MESGEDTEFGAVEFGAGKLAAATMAQIASDRERLRQLWLGLNQTESVIRRGQLAYLESTELLSAGNDWAALGKISYRGAPRTRYVGIKTEIGLAKS